MPTKSAASCGASSRRAFLRLFKVGGILDGLLVGRKVSVKGLRGVIGVKAGHLQSPEEQRTVVPVKDLYVDLGFSSDRQVRQAGIAVGDPVTYVSEIEEMANPDRLCGKAIDNRAGCAVLLHAIQELMEGALPVRLAAQFTVQEETGLHGGGPGCIQLSAAPRHCHRHRTLWRHARCEIPYGIAYRPGARSSAPGGQ